MNYANITNAIHRAIKQNKGNWNPVYADVINATGNKVGNIVLGYPRINSNDWNFYPVPELHKPSRRDGYSYQAINEKAGVKGLHRSVKGKTIDKIVPKWVGRYTLENVRTYKESNADA